MTTQDIFIVEDSPLVRERLTALLEELPETRVVGYAERADAAIAEILAGRPDVVLLDLHLAEGSGFDVLRALHRDAPEIDVYMLSSFGAQPYRRAAARLGARDFFDKSTEFERVRRVVAARGAAHA